MFHIKNINKQKIKKSIHLNSQLQDFGFDAILKYIKRTIF